MIYETVLRRTAPESNPDVAILYLEAVGEQEAKELAVQIIANDKNQNSPTNLSWSSIGDQSLWGLAESVEVVSLTPVSRPRREVFRDRNIL